MSEPLANPSIRRLIVVPAVITLLVTLLRLVGELQHWSPIFFSREAGGAGAIVGIAWLVPIFGIYFAIRLSQAGHGPTSRGRAVGFALAALVVGVAITFLISRLSLPIVATIVLANVASFIPLWIAYRGWPQLGKVEALYGLAARIPVAIVMFTAMAASWGTHYEKGPPGFPEMGLVSKWFLIGLLPQLSLWIAFTVIIGSLFGGVALLFQKRQVSESAVQGQTAKKMGAHP
jgi:NO-binding membrane sensor protein with MHYT domain